MSKSKPNASIMNLEQMKRFVPIRDRSPELERRYRKESIGSINTPSFHNLLGTTGRWQ